jgi:hypothetical protein
MSKFIEVIKKIWGYWQIGYSVISKWVIANPKKSIFLAGIFCGLIAIIIIFRGCK